MPKFVRKSIQTCFERVLGRIFAKKILTSVPWKVESSKIFKKITKISKFQKSPKSFPKVSKRVLNNFWGKFSEKFLPSFPWSVESSKLFKKNQKNFQNSNQKRTKPFTKESKSVLNMFWGKFFENFLTRVPWRLETSKFSKKSKKSQYPKMPKIVPKSIQTCFERVLGQFFRKILCPVFHGVWSLQKFSKKSKKIQNSKNAQNRSQNYTNKF